MLEILSRFIDPSTLPEAAILVITALFALQLGLHLLAGSAVSIVRMIKQAASFYLRTMHDPLVLALCAVLDWPERPSWNRRPAGLSQAVAAIGLMAVSVLCFGCYMAVGGTFVLLGEGLLRSLIDYAIAASYMLLAITCARGFMVAGVKQWYGIR